MMNGALNRQTWVPRFPLTRLGFMALSKLINFSERDFAHFEKQYAKWLRALALKPYVGLIPRSATYSSLCASVFSAVKWA